MADAAVVPLDVDSIAFDPIEVDVDDTRYGPVMLLMLIAALLVTALIGG